MVDSRQLVDTAKIVNEETEQVFNDVQHTYAVTHALGQISEMAEKLVEMGQTDN